MIPIREAGGLAMNVHDGECSISFQMPFNRAEVSFNSGS